jgi:PKHD-type hydroxylase
MLLHIPDVLSADEVAACLAELDGADWVDGRGTAGHLSSAVKHNAQLHFRDPVAVRLGDLILKRIEQNPMFVSAALPHRILPPLFNRYAGGQYYGPHLDGAIRPVDGTPQRIRTDLSATLVLSAPESYDGGELVIDDLYGPRSVKLPAGHMVLYPGTSIHHVAPVTRGVRIASFFWIQSLVRTDADRTLLFQLDAAIQRMPRTSDAERDNAIEMTNIYHNLMRRWADL